MGCESCWAWKFSEWWSSNHLSPASCLTRIVLRSFMSCILVSVASPVQDCLCTADTPVSSRRRRYAFDMASSTDLGCHWASIRTPWPKLSFQLTCLQRAPIHNMNPFLAFQPAAATLQLYSRLSLKPATICFSADRLGPPPPSAKFSPVVSRPRSGFTDDRSGPATTSQSVPLSGDSA